MDDGRRIALITDHSSTEGSRDYLARAVRNCTGEDAALIDARDFMKDGNGRVEGVPGGVRLTTSLNGCSIQSSIAIIYEIPPDARHRFATFQKTLRSHGVASLGTDPEAWRLATEKGSTVRSFIEHGIPHMETVVLRDPTFEHALRSFRRLGENVWARPAVGMGGHDVFHIDSIAGLRSACAHYGGSDWLMSRDALNFNADGKRHQYRVVVLDETVMQVCEHIQDHPDLPCNESQGAVATLLPRTEWPSELCQLAVAATKSVGLRFSGVDLALEGGGVVFEVNVHPAFASWPLAETTLTPYVRAHLQERGNPAR
jgi:glutathione synthase/RimK-type ligase-like ATP-grasp enzyme